MEDLEMAHIITLPRKPVVPFEQASVKLFTFACGCETLKCMEKHDCTAGHSCKACRGKIFRKHCGTHKGLPAGDPAFSWL
jgi:predicted SprT family Zn-dependent metalloprotease